MDKPILEHLLLPFNFSMIGAAQLSFPVVDLKTEKVVSHLHVIPDNMEIDMLCARWSHRPDVVAGTPNTAYAHSRVTEHLRTLFNERGIPWPE